MFTCVYLLENLRSELAVVCLAVCVGVSSSRVPSSTAGLRPGPTTVMYHCILPHKFRRQIRFGRFDSTTTTVFVHDGLGVHKTPQLTGWLVHRQTSVASIVV